MQKTIAFITDIHLGERLPVEFGANPAENWARILDDVAKRKPDLVVFGGDIGDAASNRRFFDSLGRFDEVRVILGNHDTIETVSKFYRNPVGGETMYYAQSDEKYKYIYLDSSSGTIDRTQLKWLEKELKSEKHIVIFIHHPILAVDSYVDERYPLANRDAVRDVVLSAGSEVTLFCGHYHAADTQTIGNLTQFVTPAASYQIKKNKWELLADSETFGYRLIHLQGKLSTELVHFKK